jgi:hypothetical protein
MFPKASIETILLSAGILLAIKNDCLIARHFSPRLFSVEPFRAYADDVLHFFFLSWQLHAQDLRHHLNFRFNHTAAAGQRKATKSGMPIQNNPPSMHAIIRF